MQAIPPSIYSALNGPPAARPLSLVSEQDGALFAKAKEFEACFLAEMLVYSGLAKQQGPFSGGIGEGQFASFLGQEQARLLVERGGIGLAERLYQAMGGSTDG